jgi:hypothetical protein
MDQLAQSGSQKTLDLKLTKQLTINDRAGLDLFIEGYNVFNTVSYLNPTPRITAGDFAVFTKAHDGRQIQWGLKFSF